MKSLPTALLSIVCLIRTSAGLLSEARPSCHSRRSRFSSSSSSRTQLLSSNGNNEDNEISKLIGKRNQIKRKKQEPEPVIESLEPLQDLDLSKLPEFRTERPVRRRKESQDEEDDSSKGGESKNTDVGPIVDFKGDYEDENDFHIPNRIVASTVAWGDPAMNFVASGKLTKRMTKTGKFVPGDLQLAHTKLLEAGIVVFETSPAYGEVSSKNKLSAEHILTRCLEEQAGDLPETILVESLGASPWSKISSPTRGILNTLEQSLDRMKTPVVELYQVPKPRFFPSILLANVFVAAIESRQCNHVGVQGVTSARTLRRLSNKLQARDVVLTSNAFEFSLTNRGHEGMIDICKALNVIPLIYNPLDDGLASGVYTATNPSGGQQGLSRNRFTFKQLDKLQPLHSVQETVTERVRTRVIRDMRQTQDRYKRKYGPPPSINTDITTTQVALNYIVAKGGVPVVPVNNPTQAKEVTGCLGWELTDEEVNMLDTAAELCNM